MTLPTGNNWSKEKMNINNMTFEEKAREASVTANDLALSILDHFEEKEEEENGILLEALEVFAIAESEKIDAILKDHKAEYYEDAESDYFDFLFYDNYVDPSEMESLIYSINQKGELTQSEFDWAMSNKNWLAEEIAGSLDYYCKAEIQYGLCNEKEGTIVSHIIGEVEEELEHYLEDLPKLPDGLNEKFTDMVKENVSEGFVSEEYIYFDYSYDCITLVADLDLVREKIIEQFEEESKTEEG